MRTYGRIPLASWTADASYVTADSNYTADGGSAGYQWVEIETDSNGYNDLVWVTTLCQVLLLNLNESPFYATYGIPQQQVISQQISPDYYVALTQQTFSQYFTSLRINKTSNNPPTYQVAVVTNQGVSLTAYVKVPI